MINCVTEHQYIKHEILCIAKQALDSIGVKFWLSCGTLLGYYRDGDTITHDLDVDIGIWAEDRPDGLDDLMISFGLVPHPSGEDDCAKYKYRGVKIDLFFHRRKPNGTVTLDLINSKKEPCYFEWTEFDLIPIQFLGRDFLIPRNPVRMLQEQYGDKWYIKERKWKWDESPKNLLTEEAAPSKNYWDEYYLEDRCPSPSAFARNCIESGYISGKVLELGCGNGRDSVAFSAIADVTGVDQSSVAVKSLKSIHPSVRWIEDDFTHLHLPDEEDTFDVVYSRFTLHSISARNEARAIDRIRKLLKHDGTLLIEVRSTQDALYGIGKKIGKHEYDYTHYRRFFEMDALAAHIESAGFKIISKKQSNGWAKTDTEDPSVIRIVAQKTMSNQNWQKQITAIIKSFEKPEMTKLAIASLRCRYPDMPIIVADDSLCPIEIIENGVKWYPLPYDVGLSEGRNFMLDRVTTPYFLLSDDDFVFTDGADLNAMYCELWPGDFDLIGGGVMNTSEPRHVLSYFGDILIEGGHLTVHNNRGCRQIDVVKPCDLVLNFFMAKTSAIREIQWDSKLKMAEHLDFFVRAKDRISVGYMPRVIVEHDRGDKIEDREYGFRRDKKVALGVEAMMRKHEITTIRNNGTLCKYDDAIRKKNYFIDLNGPNEALASLALQKEIEKESAGARIKRLRAEAELLKKLV